MVVTAVWWGYRITLWAYRNARLLESQRFEEALVTRAEQEDVRLTADANVWSVTEAVVIGVVWYASSLCLLLLSMFAVYSIPLLRSTLWLHQADTDLPVLFGVLGGAFVAWPVGLWLARKRNLGSLQQSISWYCPKRVFGWAFVAGFVSGIGYSSAKSVIVGHGYLTERVESILAFVVLAGLLQPVLEEVYFRGILFTALARKLGTIPGIIVVTLLFSFLHPRQFLTVLPVAVLLGAIRIYTGSVKACFACHAAYNLSLTLFMLPINR